jgi:hypothetical protein
MAIGGGLATSRPKTKQFQIFFMALKSGSTTPWLNTVASHPIANPIFFFKFDFNFFIIFNFLSF